MVVGLQGLAGLGFAAVRLFGGHAMFGSPYFEAAFVVLVGGWVIVVGGALVLGVRDAVAHAAVVELLLLGVAWYATWPSGRPEVGIPIAVLVGLVLSLLYNARAREWAYGDQGRTSP